MTVTAQERESILTQWTKAPGAAEQDRQARAERMVKEAVAAYGPIAGTSYSVYAKGSYPNKTSVRGDSDVDIVVQCNEVFYYDFLPGVPVPHSNPTPYAGNWTRDLWRSAVANALTAKFGSGVDASHNVALYVPEVQGSRPSADVVPSFPYRLYTSSDGSRYLPGSCVWTKDGSKIVNWPQQQLDNGRARNGETGGRYKDMVRALKTVENVLAANGTIEDLPSYFMECLVWNVPTSQYSGRSLSDGFLSVIAFLSGGLTRDTYQNWVEPNEIKPLWGDTQKWKPEDAVQLVIGAARHLGYVE